MRTGIRAGIKQQAGFSLLELMVVIVILGILATMVIPNVFSNRDKAERQKVVSDLTALENALEMYRLENGRYPTTEQGLEALVEKSRIDPQPRSFPEGGYIRRLPADPWGNAYVYKVPGEDGKPFDLISYGPEGTENSESVIKN